MAGLLYTESPPAGKTRLTDWLRENGRDLGLRYSNELKRRANTAAAYEKLR
jgi:NADH dehydrogenase